jgi:heme-binding NEAT domain protein
MECLYRQYLILPVTFFDSAIGDWTASVHIEFTEKLKVHTVVLRSGDAFKSEVQAKKFIIDQAKQWVDDRLVSAPVVQRRKHIS